MIESSQIRAARGLLKWTQAVLAAKAGLSIVTLNMIESDSVKPRRSTLAAIRKVFEEGGVEFIGEDKSGVGVRFRPLNLRPMQDQTMREAEPIGENGL